MFNGLKASTLVPNTNLTHILSIPFQTTEPLILDAPNSPLLVDLCTKPTRGSVKFTLPEDECQEENEEDFFPLSQLVSNGPVSKEESTFSTCDKKAVESTSSVDDSLSDSNFSSKTNSDDSNSSSEHSEEMEQEEEESEEMRSVEEEMDENGGGDAIPQTRNPHADVPTSRSVAATWTANDIKPITVPTGLRFREVEIKVGLSKKGRFAPLHPYLHSQIDQLKKQSQEKSQERNQERSKSKKRRISNED